MDSNQIFALGLGLVAPWRIVSSNLDVNVENSEGVACIGHYTTINGVEGVRIQAYSSSDPSRAGSLFLAMPDGKQRTRPTIQLLDAYGRPVE